jgi:hypothetical protein
VNNVPGTCQLVVRGWLDAPSAGDFDGDGAADAEDGLKKEPLSARHNDKRGRPGFPGGYFGGSHDNGHRVLFVEPGIVRSTDFDGLTKKYRPGHIGEGTVDEVGQAMGVTWAFWSETIDGEKIPTPVKPKPHPITHAVTRVSAARVLLKAALKRARRKKNTDRADLIQEMLDVDLDR